ncbi:OmpW family outer membrane protein [Helicobacter sp. 11S02629-2]|uniref:outer membrane beta-barrel protein n=1 Tax=Helicobacter sp. 11S02629-2 TaxID=1476195 RepID=UPI000BA69494|nr:OmpW family outer membrane protein [Helicobacter sp. 11S02629-2]PAF45766.1 hypothetical protein BKH40_02510 [Helicobacter sp. 11S02629-2]
MKKKILLGAVCLAVALSSTSYAKSGVFVGANAGISITSTTYSNIFIQANDLAPKTGAGYMLGLDVGYQQEFLPSMGLRYYLSYNFSNSFAHKTIPGSVTNGASGALTVVNFNNLLVANVDYFYNLNDKLGAYVGLGVGWSNFFTNFIAGGEGGSLTATYLGNSFALPFNIGVSMNLGKHQTIKLGAKIPLVSTSIKPTNGEAKTALPTGDDGTTATLNNYIIQAGYSYIF